jgi:hypothetical protein
MALEHEHQLKLRHNEYLGELERIKAEHNTSYEQLHHGQEAQMKELQQALDTRTLQLR